MPEQEYLAIEKLSIKEIAHLFSKIRVNPLTGCWEFTGAPNTYGYGQVWFRERYELLHRIFYAWAVEPLLRGSRKDIPQLDHVVCDNRPCSNPAHVKLTSLVSNVLRAESAGGINSRKTHCIHGHLLPTKPNRPPEKKRPDVTGRNCLICRAISGRRAYLKRLPDGPKKEALKQYYAQNPIQEGS